MTHFNCYSKFCRKTMLVSPNYKPQHDLTPELNDRRESRWPLTASRAYRVLRHYVLTCTCLRICLKKKPLISLWQMTKAACLSHQEGVCSCGAGWAPWEGPQMAVVTNHWTMPHEPRWALWRWWHQLWVPFMHIHPESLVLTHQPRMGVPFHNLHKSPLRATRSPGNHMKAPGLKPESIYWVQDGCSFHYPHAAYQSQLGRWGFSGYQNSEHNTLTYTPNDFIHDKGP